MHVPRQQHLGPFAPLAALLLSLLLLPAPAGAQPDGGTVFLSPVYSCETPGYSVPFAGTNGSQLIFADGTHIAGIDPKTGLVRWQGGSLKSVRRVVDLDERVMLIGEHVEVIEKRWGDRAWDFPLNCFDPAECNADILAVTDTRLVVGGFGRVFNMIVPIGTADGSQLWTSWLTTCPIRRAAVTADSVVLACRAGASPSAPLLQRIDLQSRRTLFAVPPPAAGFQADGLWAGESWLLVSGTVEGAPKLYVFSTADGTLAHKFNIRMPGEGETLGFLVSSEASTGAGKEDGKAGAGRFVPWQQKGGTLDAWGIEAATGKTAWHHKWPGGRIVGQQGTLMIVLASAGNEALAEGVDLVSGASTWHLTLPFARPQAFLLNGRLLLAGTGDDRFAIAEAASGAVRGLGTFPAALPASAPPLYFASASDGFVTLLDRQATLYRSEPVAQRAGQVLTHLAAGDEQAAAAEAGRLGAFRHMVPEARGAWDALVAFRWLKAETSMRGKAYGAAVESARQAMTGGLDEDFDRWFPDAARLALESALLREPPAEAEALLLDLLVRFRDRILAAQAPHRAPAPGRLAHPSQEELADLLLGLASAMAGGRYGAEAVDVVRHLHGRPEMAPQVESHPFWARFMLEEVRAALGAAQQAVEAGEHGLAAEMLHDLAKVPAAGELFGSAFDPWLDAQGVYLMPADLQAEKIPGLVKALIERLDKAGQATLRQTGIELCMRLCGLARRHCPARCVSGEACDRSEAACSRGCDDKGTQSWPMPPFEVPPDSPDFWNKCMPERR